MPVPVLTVPVAPQRALRETYESRGKTIAFGEGYEQGMNGVNPVALTVRPSWRLEWADAKTLLDFLTARAGVVSFHWTLPGEAAARLWRCGQWEGRYENDRYRIVTATFREVQF